MLVESGLTFSFIVVFSGVPAAWVCDWIYFLAAVIKGSQWSGI